MALGDMFSRLMTALGQLTGKTQQGELGGGAGAGADLMPEVMTMQGHWRAFLREKQEGAQVGGMGSTMPSAPVDTASMTDLDALLESPDDGGSVPPAGPGGGGDDQGDLDALDFSDLDALVRSPDGGGEAPAGPGDGDDQGDLDWLESPDDGDGDDDLADIDALFG